MAEEVKPEVIKKTQDGLRKYIKKPPLTDKLLKKPPFRFLHDIVTNVITETGFLNGLYSSEELNHENIKDRDGKVAFLEKLISAVKIITGIPLSVRATKIVAGHEPTKTNELLQAIGVALDKKLDSKDVALQLRKKVSKKSELNNRSKDIGSKDTNKDSNNSKSQKPQEEKKDGRGESTERKKHASPSSKPIKENEKSTRPVKVKTKKDGNHEAKSSRSKEKVDSHPSQQEPAEKTEDLGQPKYPLSAEQKLVSVEKKSSDDGHLGGEKTQVTKNDVSKTITPSQLEETATTEETLQDKKSVPPPMEGQGAQQESSDSKSRSSVTSTSTVTAVAPVPLARPRTAARVGSARPGAPRVRNRGEATVVTEELVRPPTVNLIVDGDNGKIDKEEEDENLVVVETAAVDDITSTTDVHQTQGSRPSSQQGQLVAQILKTQKELDAGNSGIESNESFLHHTEIEWEAGRKRERESVAKEMERMRVLVQTLTRASHPLGKLLDSLQEDVDNMHRELIQWQNMQSSLEHQLKMEEASSAQATQPLKDQLKELQQSVRTQLDQLSASKANILNNDLRIHQLLTGGQG